DVREKNQRIAIAVGDVGMLAVMPLSADVKVGDRVRVYGTLSLPQAFETDGGRTFRYDKYLEARGIRFLIQYGSIYTLEPAPWYSVPAFLARIKHAFLDGLNRALPEPSSALAGGIVIGGKQGLGTALQDAFTRSGLVQIIVLSGYNVMIVAEWVMAFIALFALPRRLQFFAGGAALLLFVGIAGISATAVRAALMAVIALYARATGRSYAASRALLVAVLLMLMWNPLYLLYDPGFGLSVAATAGIIWLAPLIEARLTRLWPFLQNVLATTLAAQISVLPLLLYNIGLFSLVALPANILVNPLVPLAMASSAIAGVVGMTLGPLAPFVATIAGTPVHLLMRYFIFIAEKAAELPFAAFMLPAFPFWLVLAAYAALIYIAASKRFSTTDQFTFAKKAST
ncbi:MAG: ComEC/Rec2 family competence protein, partial [Candidatus Pacebacteria bacterium]|nr:ComEC/Rec2 family competence protein [Candidatus Paceibacterota bacterium]